MKYLFLFIAAFCILSEAAAQTKKNDSKPGFGIRAGINFQNINGRDAFDDKLENKLVARFHAGLTAELLLADDFYIQPGLLFSTKGAKLKGSNNVVTISYIEVPVNFLYKPQLGNGRLLLGFGPYIGFGVGGKIKYENGNDASLEFKNEISVGEALAGNYLRRFDAGANILFGYELSSNLSVQLNTQWGLANIYPSISGVSNSNIINKNTGFGLSLGYKF